MMRNLEYLDPPVSDNNDPYDFKLVLAAISSLLSVLFYTLARDK